MVKNTYSDDLQRVFKSQILSPSPLIREENNLFTFSPIQDELEHFQENKQGLYIKEQVCFRNVYPANLVNPISTPCQTLISLFSFVQNILFMLFLWFTIYSIRLQSYK